MSAKVTRGPLIIQEVDGSPTGVPNTLKVSNGSLTDNGDGTFSVTTGAGSGSSESVVTKAFADSPYTASTETVILFSASGGSSTINLPAAASNANHRYSIKKTDSSANTVTVDGNAAELVEGAATQVLQYENEALTIYCDGSNWYKVA